MRGLVADGATVLLTTQYLEEADALADEISVIDHGKVIAHGTPRRAQARIVGGQTLEVRPADAARLARVSRVLAAVAGGRAESPRPGRAAVPVRGDAALTEVVAPARRRRASRVTELALRLPSLDEVFFALTGHRAEDEPTEEVAA